MKAEISTCLLQNDGEFHMHTYRTDATFYDLAQLANLIDDQRQDGRLPCPVANELMRQINDHVITLVIKI